MWRGLARAATRGLGRRWYNRVVKSKEIAELAEVKQRARFGEQLRQGAAGAASPGPPASDLRQAALSRDDARLLLDAGLATFLLHVEARIASLLGEGFYTIGPCGEELLGALGLALRDGDGAALHYRHLAVQLARALRGGRGVEDALLDRARAFVCSARDPVTGQL